MRNKIIGAIIRATIVVGLIAIVAYGVRLLIDEQLEHNRKARRPETDPTSIRIAGNEVTNFYTTNAITFAEWWTPHETNHRVTVSKGHTLTLEWDNKEQEVLLALDPEGQATNIIVRDRQNTNHATQWEAFENALLKARGVPNEVRP